jgi:2'-5' RNA ligase
LVKYFQRLNFDKLVIEFFGNDNLEDAFFLIGRSPKVKQVHRTLLKDLDNKIVSLHPEWDGNNLVIHMTILRGKFGSVVLPKITKAIFDRLVLYEIDPSPARLYANELAYVRLS